MLYEIPLGRIDEMANVSADAFVGQNDPIGNFMFGNELNHLELKRRFFRSLVTSCSPEAVRHATSPVLEAVSLWFPPRMDHSGDKDVDPIGAKDVSDPRTLANIQTVNEVITKLTEHLGQEPQWYMHLVAVHPAFKGRGLSSQLVRPMLERAKSEKLPCTLITQRMDNVQKYEHWGFRVVQEMPVPRSGEKFYSMRKD